MSHILSFNTEEIGFIQKAHTQVQSLESEQEVIYNSLLRSLNIEKGTIKEECLFDYVYNNFGEIEQQEP
jgi:hypothetical protein